MGVQNDGPHLGGSCYTGYALESLDLYGVPIDAGPIAHSGHSGVNGGGAGYSIGATVMEDGASSGSDGEPGGPLPTGPVIEAFSVHLSDQTDIHGDTFSPEALQSLMKGALAVDQVEWSAPLNDFVASLQVPMPSAKGTWVKMLPESILKRAAAAMAETPEDTPTATDAKRLSSVGLCPSCGKDVVVRDIRTDIIQPKQLALALECIGCGMRRAASFNPPGDEVVGTNFDAVRIMYFKAADES